MEIPKPGSKERRPLGIPTVTDRVVQSAVKMVIEPIFEHDFAPPQLRISTGPRLQRCPARRRTRPFERELAVYQRLLKKGTTENEGFLVPLVVRPYCLDFASAYLDELPDGFPPFDGDWLSEKQVLYEMGEWPKVESVLHALEAVGIFQADVSPTNIAV